MNDYRGRVAVITGGASGIGLGLARRLGREGAKIVLADIQQDSLDAAAATLRADGVDAIGIRADVSHYDEVEALARDSTAHFGAVHLLFNNAGVAILGPTWELSLDDWRWVLGVNLWGAIHGVKAFTPRMLAHGEPAHIVNVASEAAFFAIGTHTPYCTSKFAVSALSQCLKAELEAAKAPIDVSCVCPGLVSTNIHHSARNRPADDQPWTLRDRDPAWIKVAGRMQATGMPIDEAAATILEQMLAGRFWITTRPDAMEQMAGQAAYFAKTGNCYPVMAETAFNSGSDGSALTAPGA